MIRISGIVVRLLFSVVRFVYVITHLFAILTRASDKIEIYSIHVCQSCLVKFKFMEIGERANFHSPERSDIRASILANGEA